jgi:hypothetical protein
MILNREFDSHVIDESDLQQEKHSDPRIATVESRLLQVMKMKST